MSWTGTLARADFGPGAWVLETQGGERFALYGEVPADLKGKQVRVEGDQVDGMGFAMVGSAAIQVRTVTAA